MKVLVVSDTHRSEYNLEKVIRYEAPIDVFIHLGDIENREMKINAMLDIRTAVHMVQGNNDFFSSLDKDKEIMLGTHKAFITHGHLYGVSMGAEILAEEAKARGAEIAMFGHTHRPVLTRINGVIILNPGSISYPRQADRRASYSVINVEAGKDMDIKIKYVDEIGLQKER